MRGNANAVPTHIKGLEAIAAVFGVGRPVVRRWALEGAPILFVGRRYQANYARLCLWLEQQYPARPRTASPKAL